jgi:hypothetical protein
MHLMNHRIPTLAGSMLLCLTAVIPAQDSIEYRLLKTKDYQVFEDGITPRARVRANYYRTSAEDPWGVSPGQVSIEYGIPVWKLEYDALFRNMPTGKRWRLGSNYWTNLSSSFPFETGGRKVKPGYYYLVLEHTDAAHFNLILLEPANVTRRQLDPYHVNLKDSGPGVPIALQWERVDQVAEHLQITLKLNDDNPKHMEIRIRFGNYYFRSSPLIVTF